MSTSHGCVSATLPYAGHKRGQPSYCTQHAMRLGGSAPERMYPMCADPRDATQRLHTLGLASQRAPQQQRKKATRPGSLLATVFRRYGAFMSIGSKRPTKERGKRAGGTVMHGRRFLTTDAPMLHA
jgi:hypothetical protein